MSMARKIGPTACGATVPFAKRGQHLVHEGGLAEAGRTYK